MRALLSTDVPILLLNQPSTIPVFVISSILHAPVVQPTSVVVFVVHYIISHGLFDTCCMLLKIC